MLQKTWALCCSTCGKSTGKTSTPLASGRFRFWNAAALSQYLCFLPSHAKKLHRKKCMRHFSSHELDSLHAWHFLLCFGSCSGHQPREQAKWQQVASAAAYVQAHNSQDCPTCSSGHIRPTTTPSADAEAEDWENRPTSANQGRHHLGIRL